MHARAAVACNSIRTECGASVTYGTPRQGAASCLEPISKSSEEDNEAGELDEPEEVLGVILPADEDAALPLDPRKEAFDEPTTHVAA
jgi:hypothetical protein